MLQGVTYDQLAQQNKQDNLGKQQQADMNAVYDQVSNPTQGNKTPEKPVKKSSDKEVDPYLDFTPDDVEALVDNAKKTAGERKSVKTKEDTKKAMNNRKAILEKQVTNTKAQMDDLKDKIVNYDPDKDSETELNTWKKQLIESRQVLEAQISNLRE